MMITEHIVTIITMGGVPVFLEDRRFGFLSVKKRIIQKITGVRTEEVNIDSLKM